MKQMSIKEIAAACGGTYYGDPSLLDKEVQDVVIDSRKVTPGALFVPIKGARADGHDFIPQVMEAGALCTLSEHLLHASDLTPKTKAGVSKEPSLTLDSVPPYILVSSCRQALLDLAAHYRRAMDVKVVGITGSVGKTSTKEMIASVLSEHFCVLKTEGNFNNEIGLPLTIFRLREEHEIAVLEMGISHFGDMDPLVKAAQPDIGVITNIGYAHLENLGSRDGILKEKSKIFSGNPACAVILNGDDDMLSSYVPGDGRGSTLFGQSLAFPFHAQDIQNEGLFGTTACFGTPSFSFSAHISVPGAHMVSNALAAAAVGYTLGMTGEEMKRGIEKLVPLKGRNNLIRTKSFTILDDCYNANPASMKASLDVLALSDTRTAAILGDMGELGTDEKNMHREVGEYAAKAGIDVIVCIGELSREMARGAEGARKNTELCDEAQGENTEQTREKTGVGNTRQTQGEDAKKKNSSSVIWFSTKEEFLREKDAILKPGDAILVKASHFMGFDEIVRILSATNSL